MMLRVGASPRILRHWRALIAAGAQWTVALADMIAA